jgi:hypothetical protein
MIHSILNLVLTSFLSSLSAGSLAMIEIDSRPGDSNLYLVRVKDALLSSARHLPLGQRLGCELIGPTRQASLPTEEVNRFLNCGLICTINVRDMYAVYL